MLWPHQLTGCVFLRAWIPWLIKTEDMTPSSSGGHLIWMGSGVKTPVNEHCSFYLALFLLLWELANGVANYSSWGKKPNIIWETSSRAGIAKIRSARVNGQCLSWSWMSTHQVPDELCKMSCDPFKSFRRSTILAQLFCPLVTQGRLSQALGTLLQGPGWGAVRHMCDPVLRTGLHFAHFHIKLLSQFLFYYQPPLPKAAVVHRDIHPAGPEP